MTLMLCANTWAQTLPGGVIDAEQQRVEATREATFDAARRQADRFKGAMPADGAIDAEMRRIEGQRRQQMDDASAEAARVGNLFPNIPTPPVANVDPLEVEKRYESRVASRVTDAFVAFASFSMPRESLVQLVRTMNRAGGTVVLRGFKDDSLKATAAQMQALGIDSGGVVVNPKAFQKYRVARVPAFVVTKGGQADEQVDSNGCAMPDTYVSVSGDVSPAYALRQIIDHSPTYSPIAQRYLRMLGDVE
ncbi:type-F conjugative transfer system pilin assembly protein TrbC [Burkholderia thailandensis]|uniref:type-F conjugative transfer system pilin assembly protein TrbC n=1 Tax=Burkholderia thailandensis TaxID=57975 RepID=UPI001EE1BD6C|nr:type-F conjugative transfer system pilin assembly protein TrbC [Burkholderia thailandensis]